MMYSPQRPYETRPSRTSRYRRRRRRFSLYHAAVALSAVIVLLYSASCLLSMLRNRVSPPQEDPSSLSSSSQSSAGEDASSSTWQLPSVSGDGELSLTDQLRLLAEEEPRVETILESLEDYPEELLELLLRNEETLDFVLNYPEKKDSVPAVSVGTVTQGEFPLLMQWDSRWGYSQYGDGLMALNGCGPTCLAMVVCGLTGDDSVTPWEVASYADRAGLYVNGVGSSWELMSTGCRQFGVTARELPLNCSTIVNALEQGQPVICSVGAGDFTTSGHFIVLVAVQDGMFQVNDPNRRSTSQRLWDYDTLAPQIRNLWAYTLSS